MAITGCARSTRVAAGGTLQVALTEYRIQPQSIRTSTGALAIVVHNYGRLSHDLVISLNGRTQVASKPIPPGQTADLYAALAPGRYVMASTILSDQALGAYGTLVITR